jgi:hypothetical protein
LVPEPEFAQFADWAKRYLAARQSERAALEAEGVQLARARRTALRTLIQTDPARALALAIPAGVRRGLPDSVLALLENRVSARGSLDVFAALPEPGKENEVRTTFRVATLDGTEYDAYVYGRRLGEPTRRNVPLNGVALDNLLAVNESPLRVLDQEEAAALKGGPAEPVCAISGNPANERREQTVVEVAGAPVFLCGPAHVGALEEKLTQAAVAGDSGGGGGDVAASTRTEGVKKLLIIRVDFSDLTGAPFADPTGVSLISGLNSFYSEMSFGRAGFALSGAGSDVTPALRMPQPASYYGPNNYYNQLRTDARNAASTAGYALANYDYDVICFGAVPGWGWAGLGYVGAAGAWLRSYFTPGVAGHEIGHNFGLNHANFWDTAGQSVIGNGSSVEYGDIYDTMGSANAGAYHFNASYKKYLNWLQGNETLTVSNSGVYRVYPHDDTNSTGLRGLRIVRSAATNYWVEFRQKFTGNRWLMSGAGIRWSGNGNEKSHLLDTTPGSPDGKNDAALVLGRTFSDVAAGIHITTLRKGGTTPESLDVAVNLGTFPGNHAPSVTLGVGTASAAPGATLTFNATASDPDGDALAYAWDFGDSTFGTNGPAASKSWSSAGEYVVRCVVTDMKGGVGSSSAIITIGSPTTYRISGRITANGQPLQGVQVIATSSRLGYTDSDGTYTIVGLPAGSYTVTPVLDPYAFAASGFVNPVSVGPNVTGINFTSGNGGPGTAGSTTLTSPASGSSYVAGSSVLMTASATPSSGQSLTRVEFFQGSTKLGEDVAAPYGFSWNNVPAGSYSLTARATDSGGLLSTSAPVNIMVSPSVPVIAGQPQSETVTAGGNASFAVTVTGSAPLVYQWRVNGANLPGANSSSLSLFNVQLNQAGGYSVVVTNSGGAVTSSVATLTVSCSYALSASSASFGPAPGSGSVNVISQPGCAWTVTGVPPWLTITAGNGGSGSGTVSYTVATNSSGNARNATLTIAGLTYGVSQGAPDLAPPTVAFSSPAANSSFSNTVITVTGTADDDTGVARVECRVGINNFATATGTTAWSAPVTLVAGTNIVSVRSRDLAGNYSAVATRPIFCAVPATLNLDIRGKGSVKGGTNGQKFTIGKQYTLTATPLAGYAFSNWTGDVSSYLPSVSFVMQPSLTLTANFVTNPFIAAKGTFNGLFYETNQVRLGHSGAFTLKMTDRGAYTAAVRVGGRKHPATGQFNLEGQATNIVVRPGTNALTISWAAALDGSDQITGTVSDGSWSAGLLGDRAVYGKTNPPAEAGNYTLVLLGNPGTVFGPGGDSYGTVRVDGNGGVTLKAQLADHSVLASKASLSKHGHVPVYGGLYGGQGAILGWVSFSDRPGTDCDGVLSWIKPVVAGARYYPDGFASESALLGSRYVRPGHANPLLSLTNGTVSAEGAALPGMCVDNVLLAPDSTMTSLGPDAVAWKFNLANGLFSAKVTPNNGSPAFTGKGAALQKGNFASGYFLRTNLSGRILLQSQ